MHLITLLWHNTDPNTAGLWGLNAKMSAGKSISHECLHLICCLFCWLDRLEAMFVLFIYLYLFKWRGAFVKNNKARSHDSLRSRSCEVIFTLCTAPYPFFFLALHNIQTTSTSCTSVASCKYITEYFPSNKQSNRHRLCFRKKPNRFGSSDSLAAVMKERNEQRLSTSGNPIASNFKSADWTGHIRAKKHNDYQFI